MRLKCVICILLGKIDQQENHLKKIKKIVSEQGEHFAGSRAGDGPRVGVRGYQVVEPGWPDIGSGKL